MIDVTFLLIVFFTLVSGIADNERVDMSLARVDGGATAQADEESRVMLNVIPAANGQIGGYLLAGKAFDATPDGIAQLAAALADGYRRNPNLAVNLRADRDTMDGRFSRGRRGRSARWNHGHRCPLWRR